VRTLGTLIAPTAGSATVAGIPLAPKNGAEICRRIAIMPAVVVAYPAFAIFIALVLLFADPGVSSALIRGP
jgi:ABC-type multidrug transport system ATPase subunit